MAQQQLQLLQQQTAAACMSAFQAAVGITKGLGQP
jgi:hypothetical protein